MYRFHDGRERPSSSVTRHLQHGKTHVAADAEGDAEPDAAEKSQLEPRCAARAWVAAVWTTVVA